MGINSDWEKWAKTGKAPWEYEAFKERMEAKQLRKAMSNAPAEVTRQSMRSKWAADAINDNIRKATTRAGAMFAKPTTLGEQAAGYLKTVAPGFGSRALGIMSNPWLAAMAGMFAPTKTGNSEFIGSPEHQQWLARKGPLSKDWQ